jgi:Fur family ferric uptake transcriptional regulator
MCQSCNYSELIEAHGLDSTPNRVRIMEVIGNNPSPIRAPEIFATVRRTAEINRVTVYRILDLLVERGLVARLSGGGRSQVYGIAPNENHPAHPHFHCRNCDVLQCLQPGSLKVDVGDYQRFFAGEILGVDVLVEGVCSSCLKKARGLQPFSSKGSSSAPTSSMQSSQ